MITYTAGELLALQPTDKSPEDFFWHWLTQVVPEKMDVNGYVCVHVCSANCETASVTRADICFHNTDLKIRLPVPYSDADVVAYSWCVYQRGDLWR